MVFPVNVLFTPSKKTVPVPGKKTPSLSHLPCKKTAKLEAAKLAPACMYKFPFMCISAASVFAVAPPLLVLKFP